MQYDNQFKRPTTSQTIGDDKERTHGSAWCGWEEGAGWSGRGVSVHSALGRIARNLPPHGEGEGKVLAAPHLRHAYIYIYTHENVTHTHVQTRRYTPHSHTTPYSHCLRSLTLSLTGLLVLSLTHAPHSGSVTHKHERILFLIVCCSHAFALRCALHRQHATIPWLGLGWRVTDE